MRKIYQIILTVILTFTTTTLFAQQKFFTDISEGGIKAQSGNRFIIPQKYRTLSSDMTAMKDFLWSLPSEKNVSNRKNTPVLELPMPDGRTARFNVWESSIQEAALEAKFPGIKTFTGQGIDDPYATIRFDYTPNGFHAQVLTINGTYYLDPYGKGTTTNYISYFRSDNVRPESMHCEVADIAGKSGESSFTQAACLGPTLRTYRLAVACTGEYAQAPGVAAGSNPATLHAAIVTTVNRVVGIYEKEVAVRMVLVANNNIVEYLDATTDPFNGNNNANILINESQVVIDANILPANYDIGHTFSTGGGGLAQLNSPCGPSKARGITGSPQPTGDNYDVDYVAHEMGHQFGGNHSMAHCGSVPAGTKFEVGSGTTIQAYAGICGAQDIQPHSDPYFHAISFDEISNFLVIGGGTGCGVTSATGNGIPVIAPLTGSGLTIPVGTPFTLTGSATDPDGDALTYNWEGWDLGGTSTSWNSGATGAVNNTFPLFKSRIPKTTGSRTFPDIAVILAGYPAAPAPTMDGLKGETLSPVARPMKFRLTVRDNKAAGGGVASSGSGCQDNTVFTINVGGTAPFIVTVPNGGESYVGGSSQTVTWNVVGTNAAPFNVANVKISYSTDGGLTFPTVLLASTVNDGSEAVTLPVPGATITTAKIKVEAISNIFFDISNSNFTVTVPPTGFTLTAPPAATVTCGGGNTATATIGSTSQGGFSTPINLSVTSTLPAGVTVAFAPNPLTPGSSSVLTITGVSGLTPGTYNFTVSGTAGAFTQTTTVSLIVQATAGPVITTQPTAQTVCAPSTATFTVATSTAGATFQWQVSTTGTGGTFTNVTTGTGGTTASYTTPATTAAMTGYSYRVILTVPCGATTSNAVLLTVNTAAAITTQPANQPACTGNTATFTVVATGTGATFQWYSATISTGPFTLIPGATGSSYTTPTISGTTPAFYQVIVTTTTCAGSVTSSTAQLTISTTTAISTQPTNQTVCAPAAATFSVTASGTGAAYQWQVALAATPTVFTNIAGAISNTYNTGATTAAMNGNVYHVVVTGSCNTVTSNNVTLTVNTAAAISSQPSAVTVCNGAPASFTIAVSGTGATIQWQSAPALVGPYSDIAGATSVTYTIAATTPAMNGTYYHAVVTTTACTGTATSSNVLLTVNTVATITTQPTAQSACVPSPATFTVAATGTGLGYQWQVATAAAPTVFTNIPGATSATYTTGPTTLAMNGSVYRVLVSSTCSPGNPITSNAVVLTVNNPVTVTQNPLSQRGCAGDNYTFSVTATSGGGTITYQWQVSTDGGVTYTNIGTAGTGPSYVINNAPVSLNGNLYRVVVSGQPCGLVTTPAALLTLGNKPQVVLTVAAFSSLNPSILSGLYATVSPPGNYIYTWRKNGVIIPNTLGANSIPLTVDDFGSYSVSVIDVATGCSVSSNAVTVDSVASNRLFIYPNPVTSMMQVRYFSSNAASRGTTINVYDARGARVYSAAYTISGAYGRMDVNMSNMQTGIYLVEVRDASGKQLVSEKVMKVN